MVKVQGIGGLFFRSKDPKALADWYRVHFGINPVPTDTDTAPWKTQAGVTVFAPFDETTDYFAPDRSFMINFRIEDLDAAVVELAAAGIEISHETTLEDVGKFARVHDPDGNPIELWEPERR